MVLHSDNESTHWITSSVIKRSFWSIRKYGGQQLFYRPHLSLIRLRAAVKEPFCLWQTYWWDGDLGRHRTGTGLWLTARRRGELFWPPGKEKGVERKLYFLLRVKGQLQRMIWQRQMVLKAFKCICDALDRARTHTICTLKIKWWPNLKSRSSAHHQSFLSS